ncbi:MAG: hypothetical protein IKW54_06805, partial [Bacteroidales bacterium]|nr:hypothetical protein [Bacteroidales bacterium]
MMIIRTTDNRQRTTDIVYNLIISHKEYKIQSSIVKNQSIIRTIFIYVVLNFLTLPLVAQSLPMTLDDCMAYAVEHSTSVGKK